MRTQTGMEILSNGIDVKIFIGEQYQ